MKKTFSYLLIAFVFVLTSNLASAQYRANDELYAPRKFDDPARVSPNRSATIDYGSGHASVEWSAPSVKDRQLYGRLIPDGSVWRTGANEATVIHFDDDVLVEGEALAAGSYALFTIGSPEEWTFVFNAVSQQWGAFGHDPAEDVLRVSVAPEEGEHTEELALAFAEPVEGATELHLKWGSIVVKLNVALASD